MLYITAPTPTKHTCTSAAQVQSSHSHMAQIRSCCTTVPTLWSTRPALCLHCRRRALHCACTVDHAPCAVPAVDLGHAQKPCTVPALRTACPALCLHCGSRALHCACCRPWSCSKALHPVRHCIHARWCCTPCCMHNSPCNAECGFACAACTRTKVATAACSRRQARGGAVPHGAGGPGACPCACAGG